MADKKEKRESTMAAAYRKVDVAAKDRDRATCERDDACNAYAVLFSRFADPGVSGVTDKLCSDYSEASNRCLDSVVAFRLACRRYDDACAALSKLKMEAEYG